MDSDLSCKRGILANVFCTLDEGNVLIILNVGGGERRKSHPKPQTTNNSTKKTVPKFF